MIFHENWMLRFCSVKFWRAQPHLIYFCDFFPLDLKPIYILVYSTKYKNKYSLKNIFQENKQSVSGDSSSTAQIFIQSNAPLTEHAPPLSNLASTESCVAYKYVLYLWIKYASCESFMQIFFYLLFCIMMTHKRICFMIVAFCIFKKFTMLLQMKFNTDNINSIFYQVKYSNISEPNLTPKRNGS